MKWICLFSLTALSSCALLQSNTVLYQAGKTLPDTAYVYALPYEKGKCYWMVQGYHSFFSHHDDIAIDFKMKQGTGVYAARDGVVTFVRKTGTKGGIGRKYMGIDNRIVVKHSDGTYAHYLHLQHNGALVRVGDTVRQGQLIGLSGSTGFSAFPHLHFEVTEGTHKAMRQIPVRFHTKKGNVFLQPLRCYKSI
jgi:murein DD-endopeptidase MepM/ murein hydrolase activator NlpD